MNYLDTLSTMVTLFKKKGYNFEIPINQFWTLNPDEWQIDEVCRFEKPENVSDNSILYAVSKINGIQKAIIVNGYGVFKDSEVNKFINKISKNIL